MARKIQTGLVSLLLVFLPGRNLVAQTDAPPAHPLTLEQAVGYALEHYPAVRAAEEQVTAARAGVSLALTSYLPRADSLWQSNRATVNNIFGTVLPQPFIPSISGPVLPSSAYGGVWGSTAGLLFSWEPVDFGLRRATVGAARAGQSRAAAEAAVTRLDVAVAASDAFLTLLAAEQTVHAAEANLTRRETLRNSVHVLVNNELRPGADASRADAEVALARTNLARAEQQEKVSEAALAEVLGIAGTEVRIEAGPLLGPPPDTTLPVPPVSAHPAAAAEEERVNELRAREHILDRTDYPRLFFQSAAYGRGSGANSNGALAGGLNGLGLERGNWAAGLTVLFPNLFDFAALRAQKRIAAANERTESARYGQTVQILTGQREQARAALEGARRVAENTPVELQAARQSEIQARARYEAGLATIVEAAEAQGLLVQAEIDDALARLAVWRNLSTLAAVEGNLEPFLQLVRQRSSGGH